MLTGAGQEKVEENVGKNKILVQCLDTSGSMSGEPLTALKIGAKIIGEKYYRAEQRPFEQFYTLTYASEATMGRGDETFD